MAIQAIERKKVSDEVFEQIKGMIVSGNWKPGDKLPSEKELTELFGVSRVTIREALKKLASYNIIETSQGRGSFIRNMEGVSLFDNVMLSVYVNSAEESTIRDMMEFRGIVEIESVYLATQRATEEDFQKLRDNYLKMLDARGNIHLFSKYDLEFHKYIAKMTKNIVLIKCYSVIWDFLREYFDRVVETIGVEKGSFYHGEILRAMEDRDAKKARQLMKEHLAATSKGALESLKGKLKK